MTMASNRKDVSSLSGAKLTQLRSLLDRHITKPANNPVKAQKDAGIDMTPMIHDIGFLAHQHFLGELEDRLVVKGADKRVPLPYWKRLIPNTVTRGNRSVWNLWP
jgi:hypothetical protein